VTDRLTILVAARDEEARIGATVTALRAQFPAADVVVADDGSRDGTAAAARAAGARVLTLPRLGKGQALSLAERETAAGPLLLCDADVAGDLRALPESTSDLAVAAFAERRGGGFGIAKRAARALVHARSGFKAREPLSGQRTLSPAARAASFPLAPGFGCEVRCTIDAVRAGLAVEEITVALAHRPSARDLGGFVHRGRQLLHAALACGPLGRNHRGLRLPLVGSVIAAFDPAVAPVAALGLADDLWSGPERGFRAHLRSARTTGTLKLVGIPAYALLRTRSLSAAALVALAANALNQLDTRPGRALKAFFLAAAALRIRPRALWGGVLLAPYDLREMTMLGDAGANALGAVLGFGSVAKFGVRGRWLAIGALAGLTLLGERRSLGRLIEQTPILRELDAMGRVP
jgi:glucosyl-3-phosphoglycerate synthase